MSDVEKALEEMPRPFDNLEETVGDFQKRALEWLGEHYLTIHAALEAQRWLPIETAPRDKIIFLSCGKEAEYYCRFHKRKWCVWGIDDFDGMSWVSLSFTPTHWMPLPKPPEVK